ncbi:MAG: protein phosphatase 2C family protein, partial [Verrucomicrobia bacterium]|nr:protein phosphatase 2C family protein [Verrucomicrobiota bacterium]
NLSCQNALGDGVPLRLNPAEIYKEITEKGNKDINPEIEINGIKYDFRNKEDVDKLQMYYEKAIGNMQSSPPITVSTTINVFLLNQENKLECITYNNGDTNAFLADREGATKAISSRNVEKIHASNISLESGNRVLSVCDGVTDVISINELEEANKSPVLKDSDSADYVTKLMQASVLTGSGDDKTIVSAKITRAAL